MPPFTKPPLLCFPLTCVSAISPFHISTPSNRACRTLSTCVCICSSQSFSNGCLFFAFKPL